MLGININDFYREYDLNAAACYGLDLNDIYIFHYFYMHYETNKNKPYFLDYGKIICDLECVLCKKSENYHSIKRNLQRKLNGNLSQFISKTTVNKGGEIKLYIDIDLLTFEEILIGTNNLIDRID